MLREGGTALLDTRGTVNVLNVVEGGPVTVESPTGSFDPMVVHFAETFIVPASVGRFAVRCEGGRGATLMRAHVRGTETGHDDER